MRKFYASLAVAAALFTAGDLQAQCTTTNATSCVCAQNGQVDCDLLPDITISGWAVTNYMSGPTEYSQTGNGANDGRLRISGSTPNIGYGPFTVGAVQMWICGPDTFTDYAQAQTQCANPTQLIKQKIYHKNNNTMTYSERWAGGMTYHPSHGHMHVDDWGVFTLRTQDPNQPDPRQWPIVGSGAKVGFCLMDYGSCSTYNGHCRDANNNVLLNANFPNYNLGGGQYNCSPVEQGISSGWTDIYSENLDGMWIDIPPGTCNGNYYIVIEIDPHNVFLEADETNNWVAVPFTLTNQVPSGQFQANISASGATTLCAGEPLTLTATSGVSYQWSNGATAQAINVTQSGTYTCTVTSQCGVDASDPIVVSFTNTSNAPTATGDVVCAGNVANLSVSGTGDFQWYDAASGGTLLGTGTTFATPALMATTDYYVERVETTPGLTYNLGPANGAIGTGANHTTNTRYLIFDAMRDFTLKSVWVEAASANNRTIELRNSQGTVLQSTTVFVPAGGSRVTLNFPVTIGTNYQLGLGTNSATDLYRNAAGVTYPYTIANVASITNSSAGLTYYYFFYDWEIQEDDMVCTTPRAQVTATVSPGPSTSFTGLASTYTTVDPTVTLTGNPAGGVFSGPGISGNTFSPNLAGPGTHVITYTYTDALGCVGVSDVTTTVTLGVSILNGVFSVEPVLYPNPNNGQFVFAFSMDKAHDVKVGLFTLTGQQISVREMPAFSGSYQESFDLRDYAKGVYMIELSVDGQQYRTKLVYQ